MAKVQLSEEDKVLAKTIAPYITEIPKGLDRETAIKEIGKTLGWDTPNRNHKIWLGMRIYFSNDKNPNQLSLFDKKEMQ